MCLALKRLTLSNVHSKPRTVHVTRNNMAAKQQLNCLNPVQIK